MKDPGDGDGDGDTGIKLKYSLYMCILATSDMSLP